MKNLNVQAAVLDLRHLSEETLASYQKVTMQAALALTGPETEKLLAKYGVELQAAVTLPCAEDATVSMANGKATLTAARKPEGKTILVANGKLDIAADAGDTLRAYEKIVANGKVLCPESLVGLATEKIMVNGKLSAYPDDAVVLKGSVKLDKLFLLRAQNRLYWTEKRFVAVDPKLDAEALAAKGARFAAPKAILAERFVETLVPLFNDDVELAILPEGAALVDDDLTLNAKALRRYGPKLYVTGDVTVAPDAAEALAQMEYLHIDGDATLPAALEEAFYAIPEAEYGEVRVLRGKLINGGVNVKVDARTLGLDPEGVSCIDCAIVTLDEELTPEAILAKLRLDSCAVVRCTAAQEAAVNAVAKDVAAVKVTDAPKEAKDGETVHRMGAQLTL